MSTTTRETREKSTSRPRRSAVSRWRRGRSRRRHGTPLVAVAFALTIMTAAVVGLFEVDAARADAAAAESPTPAVASRESNEVRFEYDVVELAREAGL